MTTKYKTVKSEGCTSYATTVNGEDIYSEHDFPLTPQLKMLHQYSEAEQFFLLHRICAEIYIARNIALNNELILDNLGRIDKLYRTPSENEQ